MLSLSSLTYYPIKACRGFQVDSAFVERMGLENDRRMMAVTPEGKFLTQRQLPSLALVTPTLNDGDTVTLSASDKAALSIPIKRTGKRILVDIWKSKGVQAIDQGDDAAAWFSEYLDQPVRLVRIADDYQRRLNPKYAVNPDDHTGFADGYPILIISEASLDDLNARLESPLPMNRFRPNLVIRGCEPYAEDSWKRIRIGEVELAVVKPCARCLVTTIDKETLARSKEPLKTLAAYRRHPSGVIFGQNAIPLNEGRLETGAPVEVLS